MDEHLLLLRHLTAWADSKRRSFDPDLLTEILELRDRYDDLPYGEWPAGSAERLLLVTWPAYGDNLPESDLLAETLDTYWGFLRATGRMNARSASPADLRKETRRALPKMAAAYDDPANHSQSRVLQSFGNSIGISLDGAETVEELQQRMDQITAAWNALPQDERIRLMPDPSPKSTRAAAYTAQANALVPEPESADEMMEPGELAVSAENARSSGFVRDCLRLADWAADGRKELTTRGLLRPAIAREAYEFLDLWPWERGYEALQYPPFRDPELARPEVDAVRAEAYLNAWKSAGDCLPLDRLWFALTSAELIDETRTRAVRRRPDPETDEEWRNLALTLTMGLCLRLGSYAIEPLTGVLLTGLVADAPTPLADIEAWWDSRCPDVLRDLEGVGWQTRLDGVWYLFADCNLWTVDDRRYALTDLGRDFALTYVSALDDGLFDR
ncbi:hypothetical protein GCM10028801_06030 [Nocardioides maradonensis]